MQTEEDVRAEVARIRAELDQLKAKADFPLDFLSLATVRRPEELAAHNDDINAADVLLFYAGGDGGGNLMAFLLEQVFRGLMARTDCRAMTINGCMGTIMPMAETTACLTMSLLNDAGYPAFCESDFVVIPAAPRGRLRAEASFDPMGLPGVGIEAAFHRRAWLCANIA